jgi:hypothetical protein
VSILLTNFYQASKMLAILFEAGYREHLAHKLLSGKQDACDTLLSGTSKMLAILCYQAQARCLRYFVIRHKQDACDTLLPFFVSSQTT